MIVARPEGQSLLYRIVDAILRRIAARVQYIGDHVHKGDLYLTRWVLVQFRGRKLMLHHFHRSDYAGALHDHPWSFQSLILWPGYWEHTETERSRHLRVIGIPRRIEIGRTWYGPLSLLGRPADWRHRVEIIEGRGCWTLVWTGRKGRPWGFHCPRGFVSHQDFDLRQVSGLDGCAE